MAISLFDMMRPVALFGGLGAAWERASAGGLGTLGQGAVVLGSLLIGVLAFWSSQALAKHLNPWVTVHQGGRYLELALACLYVAIFLGIALAAYGGGVCVVLVTAV